MTVLPESLKCLFPTGIVAPDHPRSKACVVIDLFKLTAGELPVNPKSEQKTKKIAPRNPGSSEPACIPPTPYPRNQYAPLPNTTAPIVRASR